MGLGRLVIRALSVAQIARELPPESEQSQLVFGPMRNQPEVQQAPVAEILKLVHLRRRIGEREETPQPLMSTDRALRPPEQSLLAGQIHLPGSPAHLTSLELQPRFGVVESAKLVCPGQSEVAQLLGRIAELLHDRDAGIMPKAEINAVEFVAAKVSVSIVRTGHRVELGRDFIACANSPGCARVARHGRIDRDAQRVAAEAQVLRETVVRRGREVVEGIDAPGNDVELLVEK